MYPLTPDLLYPMESQGVTDPHWAQEDHMSRLRPLAREEACGPETH